MHPNPLLLHEELMLLALHDERGTIVSGTASFGLGGAIAAELLLQERIRLDESRRRKLVEVRSIRRIGDPVVDECLKKIRDAKRRASLQTWITRFSSLSKLRNRGRRAPLRARHPEGRRETTARHLQAPHLSRDRPRPPSTRSSSACAWRSSATSGKSSHGPSSSPRSPRQWGLLNPIFGRKELKPHRQRLKSLAQGRPRRQKPPRTPSPRRRPPWPRPLQCRRSSPPRPPRTDPRGSRHWARRPPAGIRAAPRSGKAHILPATMPKLYHQIAPWWPLISPPEEYEEEAGIYRRHLLDACDGSPPRTILELGQRRRPQRLPSQGAFRDDSRRPVAAHAGHEPAAQPRMPAHSGRHAHRAPRPDLRLRLHPRRRGLHDHPRGPARRHRDRPPPLPTRRRRPSSLPTTCARTTGPAPTAAAATEKTRAPHYLECSFDPDPNDTTITTDYAFVLRSKGGSVEVVHDRHITALFPRTEWLRLLTEVGFEAEAVPCDHSEIEPGEYELFVCRRPQP